ncbi:MarR family transcriptional regulator [Streptomyces sp. NPDC058001]|uniref:GbsR/MarR family transcriptional regulator n=1 Tax=Streptomyces sp. NPDC058001 TaxID=3346300 RepID=UPI0036ED2121
MPGGRLTHEDRRHIASALADGLGYAEIARRLARPTSTVSREVARNGGPEGYRADHAHHATARRARRHHPVPPPGAPDTEVGDTEAGGKGRDPEAVRAFVDEFAAVIAGTGLPRMAARVLASLVTTESGALTAAELVRRLRVSPASVSKAVGCLEGLDLVRREREGAHRRERYLIDDDVWLRTWMTNARTNATLADLSRRGVGVFDGATRTGVRLDRMGRFFTQLSDDMAGGTTAAVFSDALTVLAALTQAALARTPPLTAHRLAAALDWPEDRVMDALREIERHPDLSDPLAVVRTARDTSTETPTFTYAITVRPDRLTPAQRQGLSGNPAFRTRPRAR